MTLSILRYLFITALFFAANADAVPFQCRSSNGNSPYTHTHTSGYDHDRFGTLPIDLMKEYGAFISSFDSTDDDDGDGKPDLRAIPEFVAYQIKRYGAPDSSGQYSKPPKVKRPTKWYRDPDLAFLWVSSKIKSNRLDDSYRGVGNTYNRGHLAMKSHGTRVSWQADCNTHHFVNAVPQFKGFNQGIWLDLEYLTGAWANKFGSVWVITGPIFYKDQPIETIGDASEVPVAVPHALFKIVIRESASENKPKVLAFIYPQWDADYYKSGNCSRDKTYDHSHFLTSVSEIEKLTGLSFFNRLNLDDTQMNELKTQTATGLWPVEKAYFGKGPHGWMSCKE